ncbi:MAG TPA: DivIVA domain-containing protein [Acidimicrobiales bacterium]|nr:DivIVA domain-containing protein [Acidimicrobiales bacterium]
MAGLRPDPQLPITSEAIAHAGFRTSLRGFDPAQVREFLRGIAQQLRLLQEHNDDLQRRLREAELRAEHPVIGEAQLAAALGEETARILQSAHEAASEIRGRAEEHVERVVQQARDDSSKLTGEAASVLEVRRAAAETEAAEILRVATEEAQRLTAEATAQSAALTEEANRIAADTVEGAKAERNEVLSDVRRRRRIANTQIEQLRAGRERLLQAYEVVRATLDQATAELEVADDEAKAAAEAVGRRMSAALDPNRADSLASAPLVEPPAPVAARAPAPVTETPKEHNAGASRAEPAPSRPHRKKAKGARPPVVAPAPMTATAEPEPQPVSEPVVVTAPEEDLPQETQEEASPVAAAPVDAAPDVAVQRIAARRDAMSTLEEQLARRLKRALQDEQNLVLDRLRSVRGMLNADSALGAEAQHLANYAAIAEPALAEAARAGAAVTGDALEVPVAVVETVANDLAIELILPLRRRLDERLHEAAAVGDDQFTASDRVGSAYREVKTQRAARLAEDWLAAAWAAGVHAATPAGTPGSWASDPDHPCCTDCADNGLAGGVPAGTAFPTGHLHPPAHPGCRCVVLPTT